MIVRNILKNDFRKNLAIVISGAALSQMISIGISPVLTRLFSAEAFGLLGLFASISSVLIPFATGRYDLAIMLPQKDDDADSLLTLVGIITVSMGLIAFVLLLFSRHHIAVHLFGVPSLSPFLLLLPLAVLALGLGRALEQWVGRRQLFKLSSMANVIGAICSNLGMLLGGLGGWGAIALILGNVINPVVKILVMAIGLGKELPQTITAGLNTCVLKKNAYKFKDFPSYRVPQDSLNALGQHLPAVILAFFFSPTQVGFFWLAHRVLRMPGLLIAEALRKVFYQDISSCANAGKKIFPLVLKVTLGLFFCGLFPVGVISSWGPKLFSFAFGQQWVIAGEYARWIVLWSFCGFINVPTVVVVPILRRQKLLLFFEFFSVTLRCGSMVAIALWTRNALYTVAVFSMVAVLINVLLIVVIFSSCQRFDSVNATF